MDEMKKEEKLNRFWAIWNFIEAIVLFGAGILAIVLACTNQAGGDANTESFVAYAIGAFILLDGILRIVLSLTRYKGPKDSDESGLLIGGFELTIGIVMVLLEVHFYQSTHEHVITFLIAHFVAVLLIVIGVLLIIFSAISIAKKYTKLFMPILEILFSAILVGVGITILVLYSKENNANVVLILTGSILSIAGVTQGVITFITLRKNKKTSGKIKTVDSKETKKGSVQEENEKRIKAEEDNKKINHVIEVEQIEGPKNQ